MDIFSSHSWAVPTIITALSVFGVIFIWLLERRQGGWLQGLSTFICLLMAAGITIASWLTWIIMILVK